MTNILHVQPALPRYRLDFFERLSAEYGDRMQVFFSPGSLGALTRPIEASWAVEVGPIHKLPGALLWQPGVARLPLRRGDVIVLSGNPRYLSTLILLLRARLRGAKVVWWGHYWSSTSRRWRQVLRYLPMALSNAILFYTDNEVRAFREDALGFGKGRVLAALNNGIDIDPIRSIRAEYRSESRPNALFYIGRLTAKAQLETSFRALARMGKRAPRLHVIGEGDQLPTLQNLAIQLCLTDLIVWHGAITNEASIGEIANQCRAFLYPGEVGLSLIHAMAYGLPAIVHDAHHRHMPEIAAFKEGITGLSFPFGDDEALSCLIVKVMSDHERLLSFSQNSLQTIGPDFTTEGMAARFVRLVDQMEDVE